MLSNGPNHTSPMHNQLNKPKVWLACYLRAPAFGFEPRTGCLKSKGQFGPIFATRKHIDAVKL
jgi:hypothetical protein